MVNYSLIVNNLIYSTGGIILLWQSIVSYLLFEIYK